MTVEPLPVWAQPDRPNLPVWVHLLDPAAQLAATVAPTDFVPKAFRGRPAAVAAAVLTGHELGLGPMLALNRLHVIEGRVAMSAEAMRALVLAAGHQLWVEELTTTRCTLVGQRRGTNVEQRVTWTLDDAKRAGLQGRQPWRTYPRAMLLARASAELCRQMFPDVLSGLAALEELDNGEVLVDEPPIQTATPTPKKRTIRRADKPTVALLDEAIPSRAAIQAGPPPPDLPDGPPTGTPQTAPEPPQEPSDAPAGTGRPPANPKALRALHTAYNAAGIVERQHRLDLATDILQRPIQSSKELSDNEISQLIAVINAAAITAEDTDQ